MSKGKGRFLTGPKLENTLDIEAGDFLYVPQILVHQPINDSLTEDMELIVAFKYSSRNCRRIQTRKLT